jgi:hypothetical protein
MSIVIYLLIIFFGFLIINHTYETFIGEKNFEGLATNPGLTIGDTTSTIEHITPLFKEQLKRASALVSKIKSAKAGNAVRKKISSSITEKFMTFTNQNQENTMNMGKINTTIKQINEKIKIICNNTNCSGIRYLNTPPTIKNSSTLQESVTINAKTMPEYKKKLKNITHIISELTKEVKKLNKGNENATKENNTKRSKLSSISIHIKK